MDKLTLSEENHAKWAAKLAPYATGDRSHRGAFVSGYLDASRGRKKRNPYMKGATGGYWDCYEMGWRKVKSR